jgi:MSHA pilin protein MshD
MLTTITNQRPSRQHGFTLVELLVFIVVLAVGLTGTVLVINRSVQLAPEALVRSRAMELAQAYLDEIATKKYDEYTGQGGVPRCDSTDPGSQSCSDTLGPEGTETRATYDDVDDYHGIDDEPPVDAKGNPFANYADYRVQVRVEYAGTELGLADIRHAKRVTVIITTPLASRIPVSYYRTNF